MKQTIKFLKKYLLILFIGFSSLAFGKELNERKTDTITNWQLYLDSKILLKSNITDSKLHSVKINIKEEWKSINLNLFYDFHSEIIARKIELVCNEKKIFVLEDEDNSRKPFEIQKSVIENFLFRYTNLNKDIYIKYYDKFNPNGIIIGILILIEE